MARTNIHLPTDLYFHIYALLARICNSAQCICIIGRYKGIHLRLNQDKIYNMGISIIPYWAMRKILRSEAHLAPLNLAMSGTLILTAVYLVARYAIIAGTVPHVCLFSYFTGYPCPGCGVTRSLIAMSHFDLAGSLDANPAGTLLMVLLASQIVFGGAFFINQYIGECLAKALRIVNKVFLTTIFLVWGYRILLQI